MTSSRVLLVVASLGTLAVGACGGDDGGAVSSDEEARRAYFGLDSSIQKSIDLGFDGFNAASNANIPQQMTTGTASGMLVINGQVDQGASNNKSMRLSVGMTDYSDGKLVIDGKTLDIMITYATNTDVAMQPVLTLMLKNIPTGTLEGSLVGDYDMTGDLDGAATLNLTITGNLADGGGGHVIRMPGSSHVTGTVSNAHNGTYNVDVTF